MIIKVEAIIREEKMEDVLDALSVACQQMNGHCCDILSDTAVCRHCGAPSAMGHRPTP